MSEVALNQAVRNSLLSLQSTAKLIEQTQNRLSSGLRVAGPVDDPVAFFQAKGLEDRAFDFNEKKDSIDQGISTVTAALDGVDAIETLIRQLKGIAQSMKAANSAQLTELLSQFNDVRGQINQLAADASYQGVNLINGTGTTLSVEFSNRSASTLDVTSVDLTVATGGLNVQTVNLGSSTGVFNVFSSSGTAGYTAGVFNGQSAAFTAGSTLTLTFEGSTNTFTGGATVTFQGQTITFATAVSAHVLSQAEVLTINILSAGAASTTAGQYIVASDSLNFSFSVISGDTGTNGTSYATNEAVAFTYQGLTRTFTTADNGIVFTGIGGFTAATIHVSAGNSIVLTSGATGSFVLETAIANINNGATFTLVHTGGSLTAVAVSAQLVNSADSINGLVKASFSAEAQAGSFISVGDNTNVNLVIDSLDTALASLRTSASALGTNVAVLQTRLDFTEKYVSTLEIGGSKLTLADLNEEGANLLALQTRQQLGIQALSFAGQSEQGILALFQ